MAVELMMGYGSGGDGGVGFAVKKEETALREAASAGIQSVENLIKMLSSSPSSRRQQVQEGHLAARQGEDRPRPLQESPCRRPPP